MARVVGVAYKLAGLAANFSKATVVLLRVGCTYCAERFVKFALTEVFPAFVTKMEGTRHRSCSLLYNKEKASGAEGRTFLPLTMTPSMSNMMPKLGLETFCDAEACGAINVMKR